MVTSRKSPRASMCVIPLHESGGMCESSAHSWVPCQRVIENGPFVVTCFRQSSPQTHVHAIEIKRRAESRGEEVPDLSKRSKAIDPIANFNENGDLKWNDELVKEIKIFAQRTKPRAAGGR